MRRELYRMKQKKQGFIDSITTLKKFNKKSAVDVLKMFLSSTKESIAKQIEKISQVEIDIEDLCDHSASQKLPMSGSVVCKYCRIHLD